MKTKIVLFTIESHCKKLFKVTARDLNAHLNTLLTSIEYPAQM
jgi:hypothetical protein